MMLYCLVADGEAGAEIYAAATKRDQAKILFEEARAMVARSPALAEIVERFRGSLQIPAARSKFEPLASDYNSLDGLNPHAFVGDEIHAWKSRELWDVLVTGMGAREQPLALAITTAGDFADSIYNELHNDCEQILDGVVADDAIFAYIATPDSDDDWTTEAAWVKANPNIGVSLKLDELREKIEKAKRTPSEQNKTKRLRLNIRTAALDAWLRLDQWDKGGAPWDPAELDGRECYGGLDLASTADLAAWALVFPWGGSAGAPAFRLLVRLWCPADGEGMAAEKLRRRLYPWAQMGLVEMTEGNAINFDRIEETVAADAKRFDLRGAFFDPHNAPQLVGRLSDQSGIGFVSMTQNASSYNAGTRDFERAVLGRRVLHGGNPALRWMASNTIILENGAGHQMPSRKKSRDKIDGIVASVMALTCFLNTGGGGGSVYDERGVD
jgi:phage terminase large subunit-like protein